MMNQEEESAQTAAMLGYEILGFYFKIDKGGECIMTPSFATEKYLKRTRDGERVKFLLEIRLIKNPESNKVINIESYIVGEEAIFNNNEELCLHCRK